MAKKIQQHIHFHRLEDLSRLLWLHGGIDARERGDPLVLVRLTFGGRLFDHLPQCFQPCDFFLNPGLCRFQDRQASVDVPFALLELRAAFGQGLQDLELLIGEREGVRQKARLLETIGRRIACEMAGSGPLAGGTRGLEDRRAGRRPTLDQIHTLIGLVARLAAVNFGLFFR